MSRHEELLPAKDRFLWIVTANWESSGFKRSHANNRFKTKDVMGGSASDYNIPKRRCEISDVSSHSIMVISRLAPKVLRGPTT